MTVDAARPPRSPTDVGAELSLRRLHLLRVGYLVMGLGLAVVKWPVVIGYDRSMPLFEGVVAVILTAMSLLAFLRPRAWLARRLDRAVCRTGRVEMCRALFPVAPRSPIVG